MKIDALFLVFILSLTFVTSIKMISHDILSPINKIDTELTEIRMQLLTTEDPMTIKVFVEKITEMLKSIQENQNKSEEINKRMDLQCSEEERFRKIEILDAQIAYNSSNSANKRCHDSYEISKKFLPELESSVLDFKNQIKIKTDERNRQHIEYLALQKEWETAISFLKSFSKKIQDSDNKNSSFLQLGEDLIRHVSKLGRLDFMVPIFLQLQGNTLSASTASSGGSVLNSTVSNQTNSSGASSMSSKVNSKVSNSTSNQSNVNRIPNNDSNEAKPLSDSQLENLKKVVDRLVNQLVADSAQSDANEAILQKNYEQLVVDLNLVIKQLDANILSIKKQMNDMDVCMKNELVIMNLATAKKTRNEKLLSMASSTCTDFLKEFVDSTQSRYRQIESMKNIIEIIKKRIGEIPEELYKQMTNMNKQFKAYVNATEFKKYVEITKITIDDNVNGKELSKIQK